MKKSYINHGSTLGRKGIAHLINGCPAENTTNHTDFLVWTCSLKRQSIGFKQNEELDFITDALLELSLLTSSVKQLKKNY